VDLAAEAAQAKLRFVAAAAWAKRLEEAAADPDLARIVQALVQGKPSASAPDFAKRMLVEGEFPARIRIIPFRGRAGELKEDLGRPPYRSATRPFQGHLLRFDDPAWPKAWKVVELSVAER
jgi:hypothetical protein